MKILVVVAVLILGTTAAWAQQVEVPKVKSGAVVESTGVQAPKVKSGAVIESTGVQVPKVVGYAVVESNMQVPKILAEAVIHAASTTTAHGPVLVSPLTKP